MNDEALDIVLDKEKIRAEGQAQELIGLK